MFLSPVHSLLWQLIAERQTKSPKLSTQFPQSRENAVWGEVLGEGIAQGWEMQQDTAGSEGLGSVWR